MLRTKTIRLALSLVVACVNLTLLHTARAQDGYRPNNLTVGSDGYLYGTTQYGGVSKKGVVYKSDIYGNVTVLHSFSGPDGGVPAASPIQASDGYFYGTTTSGGTNNYGVAYRISSSGGYTVLYSFTGTSSSNPTSLMQASNGYFYGTTNSALFRMDSSGNVTLLYSFPTGNGGASPGPLVQASDGKLYGVTTGGGAYVYYGTVFSITTTGSFTTLHSFAGPSGSDGGYPSGKLVQSSNGLLYGATSGYSNANTGQVLSYGTIFQINPSAPSAFSTLHSFSGSDGQNPRVQLIGSDGFLYGNTLGGGLYGYGSLYKINSSGTLTSLHSFVTSEGTSPVSLVETGTGAYYGVCFQGGANGDGTIFQLGMGSVTVLHSFRG